RPSSVVVMAQQYWTVQYSLQVLDRPVPEPVLDGLVPLPSTERSSSESSTERSSTVASTGRSSSQGRSELGNNVTAARTCAPAFRMTGSLLGYGVLAARPGGSR